MIGRGGRLGADVPIEIDREAAREAARDELAKPIYDESQPPVLVRVGRWILDRLDDLINQIGAATPGGWWALFALLGVLGIGGYLVRRGAGPLRRTVGAGADLFDGRPRSAAEHRSAADAAAAGADWPAAVRERYRAVVRTLEERGILDERPGRTADEAAADAGAILLALGPRLRAAARIFDEVAYGAHPATGEHDDELRALDTAVRTERLVAMAP